MKQPRIRKQRANFQRAKGKMFQKQRKGQRAKCFKSKGKKAKGKSNIKKVRKRLLKQTGIEKERVLPQKDSE